MNEEEVARRLVHFSTDQDPILDRNGNVMPYLLDIRGAGSDTNLRNHLVEGMAQIVQELNLDAVIGVANSGIMWGAWLAALMNLPYATVLPDGPRQSGLRRQMEGLLAPGRAILVDNWIISGQSLKESATIVQQEAPDIDLLGVILVARPQKCPHIGIPIRSFLVAEDLVHAARRGMV